MSQNLATLDDRPLMPGVIEPQMSWTLGNLLERLEENRALVIKPDVVQPEHIREAKTLLPFYTALTSAVVREHPRNRIIVGVWLHQLNRGLEFSASPKALTGFLDGVMRASGDLPVAVFGEPTLITASRTVERMSVARVDAVVRPVGMAWSAKRLQLASIVALGRKQAAPPTEPSLTEAERDRVLAKFRREFRAAVPIARSAPAQHTIKPSVLSDEELLAQATQLAALPGPLQAASITRRDMLRRKLGLAT